MTIPTRLSKQLSIFWEKKHLSGSVVYEYEYEKWPIHEYEKWPIGNTHVNHWSSSTYMVQIPQDLKDSIIDAVTPLVQQFLGIKEEVMVTSMYGIRMYSNGAIISPHVDVLPFVATAVLNVAQKATNNNDDDDWPIELYAHDGNAYNVTLNPGDMLLYEGHSIIHGKMISFYFSSIRIHILNLTFFYHRSPISVSRRI